MLFLTPCTLTILVTVFRIFYLNISLRTFSGSLFFPVISNMSKIALPINGLVGTLITGEHCDSLSALGVFAFHMILEGGGLDRGVGAEGALVGAVPGVPHPVTPQGVVVTSAVIAGVTAAKLQYSR